MRDWNFSIRTLELENYRRFEHLSVVLDEGLNVIVGDNAAGKTALVDACAVAASTLLAKMEGAQSLGIRGADVRRITVQEGSAPALQGQYPVRVGATGSLNSRPHRWSRGLSSEKSRTTRRDARSIVEAGEELQRRVSAGEDVVLPVLARYGANRFVGREAAVPLPKDAGSFLASRTRAYSDAFDASVDERQTLTWMRNMTLWELQSGRKSPELSCVMGVFSGCYAAAAGAAGATAYFDLMLQDVAVRRPGPAGGAVVETVSSMSDGYRSAALMFADIARRMAQLNPHLGEDARLAPGIVLIDEVDLHLHPRWQARILDDLRSAFPAVQFVVTTHAPVVISSVEASALRILESGGVVCQGAETYGGNVARILKTVMGAEERPERVRERFDAFYARLDAGDYDAAEAELDALAGLIGTADTGLVAARTALFLERG